MFELRLLAPEERIETLGDALDALDALSISVEDADAQTDAEQALFGEPGEPVPAAGWRHTRLVAMVEAGIDTARLLASAAAQCGEPVPGTHALREVPEQDWRGPDGKRLKGADRGRARKREMSLRALADLDRWLQGQAAPAAALG